MTTPTVLTIDETMTASFRKYADVAAGPAGCWGWRGPLGGSSRVPQVYDGLHQRRSARQVAMWIGGRPVPPGAHVYVTCENQECVNWAHLVAGPPGMTNGGWQARRRSPGGAAVHGTPPSPASDAVQLRCGEPGDDPRSASAGLAEERRPRLPVRTCVATGSLVPAGDAELVACPTCGARFDRPADGRVPPHANRRAVAPLLAEVANLERTRAVLRRSAPSWEQARSCAGCGRELGPGRELSIDERLCVGCFAADPLALGWSNDGE
ncbi:MAG: hypothetical protein QOF51_2370 [Chloroflexota bacterium]|jgi:predicted RNA-binding Zn-ribbon protein involved in translation (DUF1610 family)|nr:hypothetical protein [Chloroflexota bacterium]